MLKKKLFFTLVILAAFILTGCAVRTYSIVKDRVDQDLSMGNRGYLTGQVPSETAERRKTRTTRVVEVEFGSPFKLERGKAVEKAAIEPEQELMQEDREYITESIMPEVAETATYFEEYTVLKNDTLQKISAKFYGTTKRWQKIYEENKDALKAPDKIYPGQVLRIPIESPKIKTK